MLDGHRRTLTERKQSYQGVTFFISLPDSLKNLPEKRSETGYKSEKFTPSKIEVELESVTYLPMWTPSFSSLKLQTGAVIGFLERGA